MNAAQAIFNSKIPAKYRDYNFNFTDPEAIPVLLTRMAKEVHPDEYRVILRDLFKLGADVSYLEGASFRLEDLKTPPITKADREVLASKVNDISARKDLSKDKRNALIIKTVSDGIDKLKHDMLSEADTQGSGLAMQVKSKSRGKVDDLQSLLIGDMLMQDSKGDIIPFPMMHGYAEGVSPAEYWANTYGTRHGLMSTKMSTADSGYLAKRVKQVSHKQVVTEDDCGTASSIEVDAKDPDSIGAVLALDSGPFKAGTIVDATMLKKLKDPFIQVRSPLTCHAREGLCAKCVGIRDTGHFTEIGDNVGMPAAQAMSEKITQAALSAKHSSGRTSGKKAQFTSGFKLIEQLMDVPENFKDSAAMAQVDGLVDAIEPAPQGGSFIIIDKHKHYLQDNMTPTVKIGDKVEAGDLLSDGIPDPSEMVKFRGIGETRKIFADQLRKSTNANRRNAEIVSRSFVDYVRITDPETFPNSAPDDIIRYSDVERDWKPRDTTRRLSPGSSVGKFLEMPTAHYSIGTKVSRRVADDLNRRGFKQIDVNDETPPFEPTMVPSVRVLTHSNDWQERMGGYHLKDSLLEAASRGMSSDMKNISYLPGIMRGSDFGDTLKTEGKY